MAFFFDCYLDGLVLSFLPQALIDAVLQACHHLVRKPPYQLDKLALVHLLLLLHAVDAHDLPMNLIVGAH